MNQAPKESIIGRSPQGNAIVSFDNVTGAQRWLEKHDKKPNLTWYKQVVTEEEIVL